MPDVRAEGPGGAAADLPANVAIGGVTRWTARGEGLRCAAVAYADDTPVLGNRAGDLLARAEQYGDLGLLRSASEVLEDRSDVGVLGDRDGWLEAVAAIVRAAGRDLRLVGNDVREQRAYVESIEREVSNRDVMEYDVALRRALNDVFAAGRNVGERLRLGSEAKARVPVGRDRP
jgi:hypothetical protein